MALSGAAIARLGGMALRCASRPLLESGARGIKMEV